MGKARASNPTEQSVFYSYQYAAKKRNLIFDLTLHELKNLIKQECFYCGQLSSRTVLSLNVTTQKLEPAGRNGIDRLNNDIGYTPENCVPCCTVCNAMKMDAPLEKFFTRVTRIYRLHIEHAND